MVDSDRSKRDITNEMVIGQNFNDSKTGIPN